MIFADESGSSIPSNFNDFTRKVVPDIFISFFLQPNQTNNIGRFPKLRQEWNCEQKYDQNTEKRIFIQCGQNLSKDVDSRFEIQYSLCLDKQETPFCHFTAFCFCVLERTIFESWRMAYRPLPIEERDFLRNGRDRIKRGGVTRRTSESASRDDSSQKGGDLSSLLIIMLS
jgi:hypothetical protein